VSLLEVRDLSIIYNTSTGPVRVVSGLDFSIPEGSVFGLAGESGCGKSLTALSIMGLLPQGMHAEGRILFKGTDLLRLDSASLRSLRGREISMIFQEPRTSLNPVLRAGYQIAEVINAHVRATRKEARRIAVGLLRSVRMPSPEARMREYPHQMSGGMRQRVMMAMAIACSPSLLIADEPTTALDVTIEAQLLELLGTLREEKRMALLLITHDLGIIAENAETVAIMYAGRIVEQAAVKDLFESPAHPYTMGLLRSLPRGRGRALLPIPGSVPRPGHLPPGCKFSDRCEYVVDRCRAEEPALGKIQGRGPGHAARCIRAGEIEWREP
jgi:oligopeptide/dipeptide ABC transporter ATP-binding protein